MLIVREMQRQHGLRLNMINLIDKSNYKQTEVVLWFQKMSLFRKIWKPPNLCDWVYKSENFFKNWHFHFHGLFRQIFSNIDTSTDVSDKFCVILIFHIFRTALFKGTLFEKFFFPWNFFLNKTKKQFLFNTTDSLLKNFWC